jgi:chemotaxis protein MotB
MSRRKKEEGEGSSERWLVSYSDFITLLMVMFVVLYSMGQVDVEKYKRLADSMRAVFSLGGATKVVDTSINQGGGSSDSGQPSPIVIPGIPKKPPQSEEVAGQLTQMLASSNLGSEVSVQTNIEGVLISLSEKLTFIPGTATLQKDAFPILDSIVTMLQPVDNPIRIIGHTDNSRPTDSRYATNFELSLGRAYDIAKYMIGKGIQPNRITISGVGEYQPIFPNDTDMHRQLNSRADIVVIYNVQSNVLDSASQSTTNTTQTTGQP